MAARFPQKDNGASGNSPTKDAQGAAPAQGAAAVQPLAMVVARRDYINDEAFNIARQIYSPSFPVIQGGESVYSHKKVEQSIFKGRGREILLLKNEEASPGTVMKLFIREDNNKVVSEINERRYLRELKTHLYLLNGNTGSRSPCPFIASITASQFTFDNAWGIEVEYFPRGTFADITLEMSPTDCLLLLASAARGIAYVHHKKIAHADIKPENFVVTQDAEGKLQAKVIDFGTARPFGTTVCKYFGDTTIYRCPELFIHSSSYCLKEQPSAATDAWSFGMTVLWVMTLATARTPWKRAEYSDIDYNYFSQNNEGLNGGADPEKLTFLDSDFHVLSKFANMLVCNLLTLKPSKRFSMARVADEIAKHLQKSPDEPETRRREEVACALRDK
ncbi:serine/threonine-protein kinase SBK1-like [Sycon ciliatum]|uniref:serine/threonine-protein kinase SBK1-like n=1 Tax=Sycon ciliatum TaxID=27933 RepID=UPI0031F6B92B